MAKQIRGGLIVPIITPFKPDESLDLDAFRATVEYQLAAGVDGLLVAGTTGEACTLTDAERADLLAAAVEQSAGRATILAGVGATTTRHARRLIELAVEAGCDGVAALTPWFQPVTPAMLDRYYEQLADACPLPLLLYHNPSRTHVDWPAESVGRIAHRLAGRAVGIKDATDTPARVAALRSACPAGFLIFSGPPTRRSEFGVDGSICALANALPNEAAAAWAGQPSTFYDDVLAALLRSENMIGLIKRLMNALGLPAGAARHPFDQVSPAEFDAVRKMAARGGRMAAGDAGSPDSPAARRSGEAPVHILADGALARCLESPPLPARRTTLYLAQPDDYRYNHHPAVCQFEGRLFAAWSAGRINEDSPGQIVRFVVSDDGGQSWSRPADVMDPPAGKNRWTCSQFVNRDGQLTLLATRYTRARYVEGELRPGVCWEDLATEAFTWSGDDWQPAGLALDDFYANEAPRPLPDGQWLWAGVNSRHDAVMAVGGRAGMLGDWRPVVVAPRSDGWKLTEPSWFLRPDGSVRALLRDDGGSRRLFVVDSRDGGQSWTTPAPTDLSDAQSKFRAVNLPDGRVALVCNPAGNELRRKLLAIAFSDNGELFDRLVPLRYDPQATARLGGMHKAAGFQYPAACLADGDLWVIYSANKEDIELARVALDA